MAGGNDEARRAWIGRVLGVDTGAAGPRAGAGLQQVLAARQAWNAAVEKVDAQIGELQGFLRNSGDEDLKAIAEFGLPGVTGGHKARLTAALLEAQMGTLDAKGAAKAAAVVASFSDHIAHDPRVEACERNPAGVKVDIRGTLTGPLAQLAVALRSLQTA